MIKTWADRTSQRYYEEGKANKLSGLDIDTADDLLAAPYSKVKR